MNLRNIYILLLQLLLCVVTANTQNTIIALGAEFDDRLDEWYLVSEEEEEGTLIRRWRIGDDFTEWVYNLGSKSGEIIRKWDHRPSYWTLRSSDGVFVEMDIKWRGDFSEWEIRVDGKRYKYYMPDRSDPGFWILEDRELGYWEMLTLIQGDVRDWESYDELDPSTPFELKMALIFIPFAVNVLGGI